MLTDEQLAEIERNHTAAIAYRNPPLSQHAHIAITKWVPTLLAEVKRLRARLPKCNEMGLTAADVGVPVAGNPVAVAHRSCPEHGDLETVAWELDAALTEAKADRDRAREIAVALEQQLAEIKRLAYMGGQNGEVVRGWIIGVLERGNATSAAVDRQDAHVCSPQTCGGVYDYETEGL